MTFVDIPILLPTFCRVRIRLWLEGGRRSDGPKSNYFHSIAVSSSETSSWVLPVMNFKGENTRYGRGF